MEPTRRHLPLVALLGALLGAALAFWLIPGLGPETWRHLLPADHPLALFLARAETGDWREGDGLALLLLLPLPVLLAVDLLAARAARRRRWQPSPAAEVNTRPDRH